MELYEKYVGSVLDGRYRIERIIGVGGMAVVFKAVDMLMNKAVAVKMLKEEIADDEESVKRFVNESKAVAMMSHRNIVSIYDVNVREDIKYIVMEYVEGITLRNYMSKRGRLTLREIISYTEQILLALSHAHSKGIVHRDIKPQNIMLLKSGIIKVTDFGIAKLPNAETVTVTDKAIGTVYYISPEQASGKAIDRRSDLYSLGTMMYEMATGELPFTADTPVSVAMMQINDTAKAPTEINPDIPKGLEQIIGIAMEKDPAHRYQSAEDMLRQLRRLKENPNIIFKIPKHKAEGEPKSVLSLLSGGGPSFPIFAGVALAFFIILAIGTAFVLGNLSDAMSAKSATIEVGEFEGKIFDPQLRQALENSSDYTVVTEYIYSDEYEAGVIIEQFPAPGASKKAGVELKLTICSGSREVTLISLTDYNYKAAIKELRKLGLEYAIEYKKSESKTAGRVMGTSPEAGATVTIGDTVTLYVCEGFEEGNIKVPDFKGMTEKKVMKKLIELDLLLGKVTYVKDDAERGTIIEQSIAKDTKVVAHTKIGFTVSGGPDFDPANPDKEPETTEAETTEDETTEAETTAPPEDTTAEEDTGFIDSSEDDTTGPNETTAAPDGETAVPDETTDSEDTTAPDVPVDQGTAQANI